MSGGTIFWGDIRPCDTGNADKRFADGDGADAVVALCEWHEDRGSEVVDAVRGEGGGEKEIREEGEGLRKHVMLACPAATGLDEFEGPAARAGGRASRQALDSLKHVIPAAAEVLLTRYINSHGLDAGWVELL